MTSNVYEIRTLDDFQQVPQERIEACLLEFAEMIAIRRTFGILAAIHDPPIPLQSACFRWRDDGKPGVSEISITMKAP